MKTTLWIIVLASMAAACASSRGAAPSVTVYEASASASPGGRRVPDGCRQIATLPPIQLSDAERYGDEPYGPQRRATAEKGGNVLLAVTETLVSRPNTNCPSSDRSADCLRGGNSWYRVSFESFACSPEGLEKLASTAPESAEALLSWKLSPARMTAAELKAKLIAMKEANISPDVMVAYVRGQRLRKALTAEQIVDWKKAGIPDAVIEAAVSR